MTMSKMPNWPAVRVPIMTQRAARPVVQRLTRPSSAVMFAMRLNMPPVPPAPPLFILERRVSAGCEMMAATTPAMTPEPRETPILPVSEVGLPTTAEMDSADLP